MKIHVLLLLSSIVAGIDLSAGEGLVYFLIRYNDIEKGEVCSVVICKDKDKTKLMHPLKELERFLKKQRLINEQDKKTSGWECFLMYIQVFSECRSEFAKLVSQKQAEKKNLDDFKDNYPEFNVEVLRNNPDTFVDISNSK